MEADQLIDFIKQAPGPAVAIILVVIFMRAIKGIVKDHNESYKANTEVLKENNQVIGECSAALKDCRDAIRHMRGRMTD